MPTTAGIHVFLSLFTTNQRTLVIGLFEQAANQRAVKTPSAVLSNVLMELSRRCFQSFGDSESKGYAGSFSILCDHKQEAEQYATNVLRAAGKLPAKKGAAKRLPKTNRQELTSSP